MSVRVKSLLDAVEDGAMGGEEEEEDLMRQDHGSQGLRTEAGTGAGGAAAAPGAGAIKGDEGDEGGAAVEWSGERGPKVEDEEMGAVEDGKVGWEFEEGRSGVAGVGMDGCEISAKGALLALGGGVRTGYAWGQVGS